jgi:hypothetical protein
MSPNISYFTSQINSATPSSGIASHALSPHASPERKVSKSLCLLALAPLFLAAPVRAADPLPAAQVVDVYAFGNIYNYDAAHPFFDQPNITISANAPFSLSQSNVDFTANYDSISYAASLAAAPSMTMNATEIAGPLSTDSLMAGATLQYSFEVLGPQAYVPVLVNASLSASASGAPAFYTSASAQLSFEGPVNGEADIGEVYPNGGVVSVSDQNEIFSPPTGPTIAEESGVFNLSDAYTLQTGQVYTVQLDVGIEGTVIGGGEGGKTATESASVDPTIVIAPGTPDAGLYSVEFSPGVGNGQGPSVPDTCSTFALSVMAVAALAGLRRLKRPDVIPPDLAT